MFRKSIIIIVLILCSANVYSKENHDYYDHKLIVGLDLFSDLRHQLLPPSGSLVILDEWKQLLGDYSYHSFISNTVLNQLRSHIAAKNTALGYSVDFNNSFLRLSGIIEIEYSSDIPPDMAAKKLASFPGVRYAEPLYKRHIFADFPNDPFFSIQYYLENIKAIEAWDEIDTEDTVVIGIVDTGIDYNHEDLKDNIYTNYGETGTDTDGNDKRTNGIDDDGNGFIDDWRGWDFVSSDSLGYDNDPHPGHEHGTHLAGLAGAVTNNSIGIAGTAKNIKLMPVKVGSDNPLSTSVSNSYEGILFAAMNGADIINCSWGGPNNSQAEQDIINTAAELGAVIVAAAGNDNRDLLFYPAAYDNVLSVTGVDHNDKKAYFSNYNVLFDVAAPGYVMYSTLPGNRYDAMNGTSMASPVVAGVAALVKLKFPEMNKLQIIEQIKANCDNIDSLNESYKGKLGRGRVNAYKAVTNTNSKSATIDLLKFTDGNQNGVMEPDEEIDLSLIFFNILSPLKDAYCKIKSASFYSPEFIQDSIFIGDMETLENFEPEEKFSFTIPFAVPMDYSMSVELEIYDAGGYVNSEYLSFSVRPSFKTFDANDLAVTFNSRGNIGFNDYSANTQGVGFKYKDKNSILFEGALMVANGSGRVSDVARGSNQTFQNADFIPAVIIDKLSPGTKTAQEGTALFYDNGNEWQAGVSVQQRIFQFDKENKKNFIVCNYEVTNNNEEDMDSLYVGLYFDWDIGPSGANNQTIYSDEELFGYTVNVADDSLPLAGVKLCTPADINFFAMDNNGGGGFNPGVYDGFTRAEKWQTMSSGIGREESNVCDASMVMAAGPLSVASGERTIVSFVLFSAMNIDDLTETATNVCTDAFTTDADDYRDSDLSLQIVQSANSMDNLNIIITADKAQQLSCEIFDYLGNKVGIIFADRFFEAGQYTFNSSVRDLAQGMYLVKLQSKDEIITERFYILK